MYVCMYVCVYNFMYMFTNVYVYIYIYGLVSRVGTPHPPPLHGIPPPPPNGKARNPRKGRTFVSKVPTVTGMGPPNRGSS